MAHLLHMYADEQALAMNYRILNASDSKRITADINVPNDYLRSLVFEAFVTHPCGWNIKMPQDYSAPDLLWDEYENLDWKRILKGKVVANSYCVRKGIARKAQLSLYLEKYITKNPSSCLVKALPRTIILDTWDAFNNELALLGIGFRQRLDACLHEIKNILLDEEQEGKKKVWILKPSATNKGAEVNVITNFESLRSIVFEWTDIREWVVQEYIPRPLLLKKKKFHIRAYVLAVASLQVYLFEDVLLLTAMEKYEGSDHTSRYSHITNTVLQQDHPDFSEEECVCLLDDLKKCFIDEGVNDPDAKVNSILSSMGKITADLFDSYKGEFSVFQPLPNCFELYGVDFMVDQDMNVWLLEVNPGPDFKQTGYRLHHVIASLVHDTVQIVSHHFFGAVLSSLGRFRKVYDEQWGYRATSSSSMTFS